MTIRESELRQLLGEVLVMVLNGREVAGELVL